MSLPYTVKGNDYICDKILEEASELVEASEDTHNELSMKPQTYCFMC